MAEEIDLGEIKSNKDEAPDYRPMLQENSRLGAPPIVDVMRYIVSMESEESSRYSEFARIADGEGLEQVARIFRKIQREGGNHASSFITGNQTLTNLKVAIRRELEKIDKIAKTAEDCEKSGDNTCVPTLKKMIKEERGHVDVLKKTLAELEKETEEKEDTPEPDNCSWGVCPIK